jgi:hypothetical protein
MTQAVKHLTSKSEALSSNPYHQKEKQKAHLIVQLCLSRLFEKYTLFGTILK